jgi:N-acetylmuramic acid 6-phosphate (MurNAc-6-P) etherase
VAVAFIMLKTGLGRAQAVKKLKSFKGNVRRAVADK